MNRPVIDTAHTRTSNTAAQHAKPTDAPWWPTDAPWWQLYSVLIITIGTGIVIAFNDPALLHNPIVLLACVFAFFGFVLAWCHKHFTQIEAEDWRPGVGQTLWLEDIEPTTTPSEQSREQQ